VVVVGCIAGVPPGVVAGGFNPGVVVGGSVAPAPADADGRMTLPAAVGVVVVVAPLVFALGPDAVRAAPESELASPLHGAATIRNRSTSRTL
jgi:hypothetical protein